MFAGSDCSDCANNTISQYDFQKKLEPKVMRGLCAIWVSVESGLWAGWAPNEEVTRWTMRSNVINSMHLATSLLQYQIIPDPNDTKEICIWVL
jgi:hypothetical protein